MSWATSVTVTSSARLLQKRRATHRRHTPGTGRCVAGFVQIENTFAVVAQVERHVKTRQGQTLDHFLQVIEFGFFGLEEFASRRGVEKQIAHFNRRAHRMRRWLNPRGHVAAFGFDLPRLLSAALLSGLVKGVDTFMWAFPRWSPSAQLERLTFTADPSLLLVGFGGIIGIRVGLTLLLGALLAWGGLGPWLLAQHLVTLPAGSSGPQFAALVEWLLWPGVSLMVCSTLASLAIRLWALYRSTHSGGESTWTVPKPGPAAGFVLAIALVVSLQALLFGINLGMALLTIPLAICLAAVAARVVGATGIPPIGAIGQLSQLSFGIVAPGQVPINLMSANTAGGSAGQCTDLMNDFKVGKAIGATPHKQVIAQILGIFIGSIVGVFAYLALIPDPQSMLLTEEWPAPAVATWKAVAQTLTHGLDSLSTSIRWAIAIGGLVGVLLGILDSTLPAHRARYLPSAAALGLAFVLPASVSLMMALGAILTWLVSCRWPSLTERFAITAAAGLIAGESITGVGASLWSMVGSG